MRKFTLILIAIISIFFTTQTCVALDYSKISTNSKITKALDVLYNINRRDVIAILYGKNATKKPIRVMFRDLAVYNCQDCEALTIQTKNNGLVIYINNEHKGASAETIACLIAHESQHHTFTNSKAEELRAWISEAQAWNEITKRNKALLDSKEPLAQRENYIAKIKAKNGIQGVQKIIATNPVYAGLN